MQNAWRVVDCTNLSGQLKYSRGHLKVCNDHDNKTNVIALSDIAVLLIGLRCSCSAGLLHQCAQYGVSIMPCDWRGVPVAAFHPWLGNSYTNSSQTNCSIIYDDASEEKRMGKGGKK